MVFKAAFGVILLILAGITALSILFAILATIF